MSNFYAIQDTNNGFIQYIGEAGDERAALAALDADVGIDPNDEGLEVIAEHYEVTEITQDQYQRLADATGDDQSAIDYLESIK